MCCLSFLRELLWSLDFRMEGTGLEVYTNLIGSSSSKSCHNYVRVGYMNCVSRISEFMFG